MAEYIKRSYIRKMAMFEMAYTMETETDAAVVLRMIEDAPTADVSPVVHGRWIRKWDLYDKGFYISRKVWYECSNCGMKTNYKDEPFEIEVGYNYCPNCGAKMDGSELSDNN